jgi:succinoglycan biosynthesis transport protein ExoP
MVFCINMLQLNKAQSEINREPTAPEILSGPEALQAFVSFLRRQSPIIVFGTLLVTALGVIYLMTARPSFTAQAQLMIDARKVQIFQQQSILGDIPIDTAQVESQVEVLKSENIASAVIKNLHLTEEPEFIGSGGGLLGALFGVVFNQFRSDQAPSEFEISRRAMDAFQSRMNVRRVGLTYVIQIAFQSYDAGRAAEIVNAIADAYIVDQLEAKYQATRRASSWLQDRIKELRDQVSSAERAVVEFKTSHNIVNTGTGGTGKQLLGEQQVTELSSQLVIARASTAETKARLDRIDAVLKLASPNASFGPTVADTLKSDVVSKLRSEYLELAAREADWSVKYGRDHLAVVSLRNRMREIRNAIFDELKRLAETYKSDYEIAKQRELGVQKELARAVSQSQETDSASVSLRDLQSTAQTYKSLYDNFLQRYMESVQQQSFPISEARLISSASRPLHKSSPKAFLVLAIASLGGMAIGFGMGILRDLSDRVFRSSEQVENLLHADCIALVPVIATNIETDKSDVLDAGLGPSNLKTTAHGQDKTWTLVSSILSRLSETTHSLTLASDIRGVSKSAQSEINASSIPDQGTKQPAPSPSRKIAPKVSRQRKIARDGSAIWTVIDAPLSRFTEAIRSIKLANDLNGVQRANQVVGLTSSLPNEGKSTIAFSLAQIMSQAGARTILVDCDLRNPSLSRTLAPRAKIGLIDVLAEKVSLEEAICNGPSTNMSFLPVVVKFRLAQSTEILGSVPLKKLFKKLRESYDYVVVDLPPLAPVVDVRATLHLIDSFVFVVEWGRTKIDVVEHALSHAQGVYDNLLGVVLNKVDMNIFSRYAGHRESYYYNEHYRRYGYTE